MMENFKINISLILQNLLLSKKKKVFVFENIFWTF